MIQRQTFYAYATAETLNSALADALGTLESTAREAMGPCWAVAIDHTVTVLTDLQKKEPSLIAAAFGASARTTAKPMTAVTVVGIYESIGS